MHPFGCFGSSLACDKQSNVCMACVKLDECHQQVEARKPQLLLLLSKFADIHGQPVSNSWMTKQERAAVAKKKKQSASVERETIMYGCPDMAEEIRLKLDKRARPLFNRYTKAGVNIFKDSLSTIASIDRPMAETIKLLKLRPHTMKDLTAALAQKLTKSEAAAQRDAYVCASILTVSDRAHRVGPNLELQ